MKKKKIMEIAVNRLDTVITEMNTSTSTLVIMGYAGIAHDLVKIIKIASGLEDIEEEEGS